MILSDLTLSGSASSDNIKQSLESKLGEFLPAGSYTVILRNYQGDFRARSTNQAKYQAMFLLKPEARQAVLANKDQLEAAGFRVSSSGDLSAN